MVFGLRKFMNDQSFIKSLLRDLMPAKKFLFLGILLYIPVTFLSVIQPMIIGVAVQNMLNTGNAILLYSLLFFLSSLMLALCELLQGYFLQLVGQKLVFDLRKRAFSKVQKLSMGFLDSMPVGKLLTRLLNDPESVGELFSMGAVQIVADSLFLLGTLIMLFMVDIKLSLYASLSLPFLAIGIYFFRYFIKITYIKAREVLSNLNGYLQEYLSGIATVQLSGRLTDIQKDLQKHNQIYLETNQRAIFLDAAVYSFIDAISYIACALVLWGGFNLRLEHALSLGILVAFLEALSRFFQPMRDFSNRYAILQSALVSLDRIYQLFLWPEEIDNNYGAIKFNEQIQFDHVSFAYPNGAALKDISFTIKKFERIALVGHTGAGKSTVIKLLNRFYKVNSGRILIDGKNIDSYSLEETRRLISVVPQEIFLFHGTLRENLAFGKANASDEELWHALELVQMADFIRLKGGLKSQVLAKGQNFSQGERQLLAIGRAIVTDPPILILDEATASVDTRTEKRLQEATKALLKNRTALVIAHKLSTIMDADRILVFKEGQLVEEGTHDELLKQNLYSSMSKKWH
jgi:ATP-binding cassette subfamily B multidrug efflux pump